MNPFLAFLIKSSVSLALLYCLFRLTVRSSRNHALNRYLLLGILFLSAIIPVLNVQLLYEEVQIAPVEFVREFINPSEGEVISTKNTIEAAETLQGTSINYWLISYLALSGIICMRLLFGIFQVAKILKRAEKQTYREVVLAIVKDFIQPFSFLNKVVLSEKDYTENKDIVVAHEYAHIKYFHAVDLMICELFTIVQFFNPFMWLLRHDLKLIHEYQADKAVLNKGIDAQKYQLLVLEKAVGERRFAMANHFTQKPILKRLNMMNKNKIDKWAAVKIILFVPIIAVLLQAFARPEMITKSDDFIPVRYTENKAEKWLSKWKSENIGKGIFEPGIKVGEHKNSANNFLVILMNSKDRYLVENELTDKSEIKGIAFDYLHGKNPDGKQGPDFIEKEIAGIGKLKVCNGLISYRHDLASSGEAVNFTLRQIGEAYLEARQKKAQVLFNMDYFDLDEEKQLAVNEAVPVWFAYEHPKGPKPSVWLPFDGKPAPNPKPFLIKFKNNGEVIVEDHTFHSLDEFYKNIEVWSKELADFNKGKRSKAFYRAYLFYESEVYKTLSKDVDLKLYKNNIHVEHISVDRAPLKLQEGKLKDRTEKVEKEVRESNTQANHKEHEYAIKIDDASYPISHLLLANESTQKEGKFELHIYGKNKLSNIDISLHSIKSRSTQLPDVVFYQFSKESYSSREYPSFYGNVILNGKELEFKEVEFYIVRNAIKDFELGIKGKLDNGDKINVIHSGPVKYEDWRNVNTQKAPAPPPPVFRLHLYENKIMYDKNEKKLTEVASLVTKWLKRVNKRYVANIQVHGDVSDERINALKGEMKKGGISTKISIRKLN